jgi:hypothetical protein
MEYTTLGNTGLLVSRLCFELSQLPCLFKLSIVSITEREC